MSDFLFFIKLFFLTVAVVLVMQIQIGNRSLESHAIGWVQTSSVTMPLNAAAEGGAKIINDFIQHVHSAIAKNTGREHGQRKKEEKAKAHSSSFHWN
jgi:hypothetical protein